MTRGAEGCKVAVVERGVRGREGEFYFEEGPVSYR